MGNFKDYTTSNKSLGQSAPSAWKCPKTPFEALKLTENLNPLQGPIHTLTPSSINTQNKSKNYVWFIMACIENSTEKQGFPYPGFQKKKKKNFGHTYQNPLKSINVFCIVNTSYGLISFVRAAAIQRGSGKAVLHGKSSSATWTLWPTIHKFCNNSIVFQ